LTAAGFTIESIIDLNKAGHPAWWFAGKVLKRDRLSKLPLKIFDKTVWLWRLLDKILPWRGLSMLVVAVKKG